MRRDRLDWVLKQSYEFICSLAETNDSAGFRRKRVETSSDWEATGGSGPSNAGVRTPQLEVDEPLTAAYFGDPESMQPPPLVSRRSPPITALKYSSLPRPRPRSQDPRQGASPTAATRPTRASPSRREKTPWRNLLGRIEGEMRGGGRRGGDCSGRQRAPSSSRRDRRRLQERQGPVLEQQHRPARSPPPPAERAHEQLAAAVLAPPSRLLSSPAATPQHEPPSPVLWRP